MKKYNLSLKQEREALIESLGGRAHLHNSLPVLLETIDKTEVYAKAEKDPHYGLDDDLNHKLLFRSDAETKEEIAIIDTWSKYLEKHSYLLLQSSVIDTNSGNTLAQFNLYTTDSQKLQKNQEINLTRSIGDKPRKLFAKTTYVAIDCAPNGESKIYMAAEKILEISSIPGAEEVIKNIVVTDPMPKPGATFTKIVYLNRDVADAKYKFPKMTFHKIGDNTFVDTAVPLKGSVSIGENLEIDCLRLDSTFSLKLSSTNLLGSVEFNSSDLSPFIYKISENRKTLTWEFPDVWNAGMALKNYTAENIFDLYLYAILRVRPKGATLFFDVPFLINSDIVYGTASKLIPKLHIVWGCLGKDSMIRMADFSQKPISSICRGDMILTVEGRMLRVQDIVRGYEQQMVLVQGEGGDPLLLSDTHPIGTRRGMVAACMLNAADELQTENGSYIPVIYLDRVNYSDTVYSLILDDANHHAFWANGYATSDFDSPCRIEEKVTACPLLPTWNEQLKIWEEQGL